MKVLLQNRLDAQIKHGGDTVQMMRTCEGLNKLGVQAEISLSLRPNLEGYDLVHLFNISRVHETALQMANALRSETPIVVSPIYHDYDEFLTFRQDIQGALYRALDRNLYEIVKEVVRSFWYLPNQFPAVFYMVRKGYKRLQEWVLTNADFIITTSQMEYEFIRQKLEFAEKPYSVAVNAPEIYPETGQTSPELENWHDYILCVSRIEPVKNQLSLIEAVQDTGLKLVLAGSINRNTYRYAEQVLHRLKSIGGKYLGRVPSQYMAEMYRRARVFCLPSWFETTGLVSLEACVYGVSVVLSDRGYVRAYFDDRAVYCDPSSIQSMRQAIFTALEKPPQTDFSSYIKSHYTWDHCAEQTMAVYNQVLATKRGNK